MSDTTGSGGAFTSATLAKARRDGALHHYWTRGEGAARIRWGTPGDFERCVRQLREHASGEGFDIEGYCARLHHSVTGLWPGDARNPGRSGT